MNDYHERFGRLVGQIEAVLLRQDVAPEDRWLELDADILRQVNAGKEVLRGQHVCYKGVMLCNHGDAEAIQSHMDRNLEFNQYVREEAVPRGKQ
jgi:hypothetical protein